MPRANDGVVRLVLTEQQALMLTEAVEAFIENKELCGNRFWQREARRILEDIHDKLGDKWEGL